MTIERCGDCHFYEAKEKECRARPPTPFPFPGTNTLTGQTTLSVLGMWPATRPENWCGKFRPKASA